MEYRTRKIVKGGDLNGAGNLFGGRALEWIDEEGAIFAFCQLGHPKNLVTKAMSGIEFLAPGHANDLIEIGCETIAMGRTSITIRVSMRNKTTENLIVNVDKMVFVNLDENGTPTPHYCVMPETNFM
jgi:acyl-CoA thioesterase YciA